MLSGVRLRLVHSNPTKYRLHRKHDVQNLIRLNHCCVSESKLLLPRNSFSAMYWQLNGGLYFRVNKNQRARLITFCVISTITLITIAGSGQFVNEKPAAVLNFYFWQPATAIFTQDETNITCHHSVFDRRVSSIHPTGKSCSTTSIRNLHLGDLRTSRANNHTCLLLRSNSYFDQLCSGLNSYSSSQKLQG